MADRGSFSEGGDLDLLVLLPDGRSVTHITNANCPMMDLLIQIASKENLKPSAYTVEPLASTPDDDDHSTKPVIKYKPNTPIGMLNTQVIRLGVKNTTGSKMPSTNIGSAKPNKKINYSESFSNRVQNFNKLAGVSAVAMCNDPDGFVKLSEDTKRIKSRSNFITSTLPPQVSGNWNDSTKMMNTFRLQIHLPFDQLHVIRASPEYTIRDVLDIIQEERGLKLERYLILKTNEPDITLNIQGTLKEYGITELTLKMRPEFDVIRNNMNPKKIKKENSSHFRSAFKSFFHQLKPSSRSNSVTELRHTSDTIRPKSEIPSINHSEFIKPKPPPRKRAQAPPPPIQSGDRVSSALATSRSHTASESSCESACEGSVGGSAPATLPRRCRLGPESVSTINLAMEPPLPALRRGVSDMAVNKPKYPRRKRLAPKPPASSGELKEDGIEEQVTAHKTENIEPMSHEISSSHKTNPVTAEFMNNSHFKITNDCLVHLDRINDKREADNEIEGLVKSEGIVEDHLSVQVEESYSEIEIQDNQKIFHQEMSNGKRFIAVDIDIDEPKDPNKDNVDLMHNLNDNINQTDFPGQSQIDTEEMTNNSSSTDTSFDKKPFIHETEVSNANVDVQVEVHTQKESETEPTTNNGDTELTKTPSANHVASDQNVESLPAVDMPESKVLSTYPRNVDSIHSNRQSLSHLSNKIKGNQSKKSAPQRSLSTGSSVASKPTVEELLRQIQKLKQKNTNGTQNNIQGYTPILHTNSSNEMQKGGFNKPEVVGLIEKQQINETKYESCAINTCVTPPVTPVTEDTPTLNGNVEEAKSRVVTDVVTKLYSVENQISDPVSAKARPLPTFMLTSWAEEKKAPVVNRIADYGSRSSSTPITMVQTDVYTPIDRPIPFALSATLPRPFTKPADAKTLNSITVNKLPTIINVLEKTTSQKQNDKPSVTNEHQSSNAKLNLFNISHTLLPDSLDSHRQNGTNTNVQKTSWELVQDASKKLQNKTNGHHIQNIHETIPAKNSVENIKHTDKFHNENQENDSMMFQEARPIYKYPKHMQFQFGTWKDKDKDIKIETDVKLDKKNDPPLVKEIDAVAWRLCGVQHTD